MKKRMNKKRKKGGGQKEPRRGTEVPLLRNTTHKGAWVRSTQSINSNAQFPPPRRQLSKVSSLSTMLQEVQLDELLNDKLK